MSTMIRVSNEFYHYVKKLIANYEKETGFTLSSTKATDIIVKQLEGKRMKIDITIKGLVNKSVKTAIEDFWG